MKPLRDTHEFSSESERRVAELLATLDPYKPNPARKHNLGMKLAGALSGAAHQPRGLKLLRPVVGVALLFAGTAAAATLGQRFWPEPLDQAPEIPVAHSTPLRAKPPAARARAAAAAPPAAAAESPAPAPVVARAKPPTATAPRLAAVTKKQAARSSEDPRPVVEALRALRKEHDPARAQSLLNDYMQTNPQGALSEEALALSIEAAHARKDPAAKSYARRYLARYPAGRQRRLAERVLAGAVE